MSLPNLAKSFNLAELQSPLQKSTSETGKDTRVRAACHHQTQSAMTAIESLGRFIQIAGHPRWRIHTLTDHLVYSFQANVFITGNKQGAVRGFEIQGGSGRRNCNIPVLGG